MLRGKALGVFAPVAFAMVCSFFLAAPLPAGSLVIDRKGHVDCGDIFAVPKGTMEFWIKPASMNNNEWLCSMLKDKQNVMEMGFGPGNFMLTVRTAGENRYVFIDSRTIPAGKWSHVAWTFEKDRVWAFVNGARVTPRASDPGGNYGLDHLAGAKFLLGRGLSEKEFYNGLIAGARLSDNIRYTGSFTPAWPLTTDANTIALWRFDQEGAAVADASGKNHNGVIVGTVGRSVEEPGTQAPLAPPAPAAKPAPVAPAAATAQPVAPAPAVVMPKISFAGAGLRTAIRADGTLLVNDKPVFPVGIRTEQLDSLKQIAGTGFNLVLGSGEWGPDHYKAALDGNLLVLGGFYEWATFATFRGEGGIDIRTGEEAGIRNVLTAARDQGKRTIMEALNAFDGLPNVIGWNTNEEPEAKLIEASEYGYEIFKSYNPRHIVVTLSDAPKWFPGLRNTADVLIVDNYPFRGSARNKRSLLESYEYIREACDAMKGKAVWLMPQLLTPSEWSRDPADDISLADMRLQNYAGLIGGAKGILMYHWASLRVAYQGDQRIFVAPEVFERRWNIAKTVAAELSTLGPIICDGRPTRDLDIFWIEPGPQGPGPQLTRELDYYGTKYLLVMNLLDVPIEGKVYGMNGGNRKGYDGSVFLGQGSLTVTPIAPGESRITVGPRGAGVFLFERRPISAPEGK